MYFAVRKIYRIGVLKLSYKNIVILGSTGSIGTQTLDVVRQDKKMKILALTTHTNIELLEKQIIEFSPILVSVMDEHKAQKLRENLLSKGIHTEVLAGMDGLIAAATLSEAEIVLTAVVGMVGLIPTIEAIKQRKTIALANKETLVAGGDIVMKLADEYGVRIIPVDSEHCAIFQCLQGNRNEEVSRLIITASGGPFREATKEQLSKVTVEDALKHPNWSMGPKITVDSATLMNKGLEVIEAKHLFNMSVDQIDVVIHKESIIHSMVEYIDGSVIAQLSCPDMRHPISYALHYPHRKKAEYIRKIDFKTLKTLSFDIPNVELFPCLNYAYQALTEGGTMPTVLNAANETVVEAFLNRQVGFLDIPKIIHKVMEKHISINRPTIDEILFYDQWAREYSKEQVKE